jgi:hypothetical protein
MSTYLLLQLVTGAIGGGLVTSFFGPYLLGSTQRRTANAQVLTSLLEVERARFVGMADTNAFYSARNNLLAVALIAGVNREITEAYAHLATVARCIGDADADEGSDEYPGSIPTILDSLVRNAAVWRQLELRVALRHQ